MTDDDATYVLSVDADYGPVDLSFGDRPIVRDHVFTLTIAVHGVPALKFRGERMELIGGAHEVLTEMMRKANAYDELHQAAVAAGIVPA